MSTPPGSPSSDTTEGRRLYHLALAGDWAHAQETGAYIASTIGRSLGEEGFVHCSFAEQVQGTADAYYRGREDVILLKVDPARVPAEIRLERPPGRDNPFPHVYGPIPVAAVEEATALRPDNDGHLLLGRLIDEQTGPATSDGAA